MPRRLIRDVYLPDRPFGEAVRYRTGTPEADLPDGVAARIVNPLAWGEIEPEQPADAAGEADGDTSTAGSLDELDEHVGAVVEAAAGDGGDDEPASSGGIVEPPRGGRGATTEAWAAYAAALGQPVEPDATRDEIVEQLTAAGFVDAES